MQDPGKFLILGDEVSTDIVPTSVWSSLLYSYVPRTFIAEQKIWDIGEIEVRYNRHPV